MVTRSLKKGEVVSIYNDNKSHKTVNISRKRIFCLSVNRFLTLLFHISLTTNTAVICKKCSIPLSSHQLRSSLAVCLSAAATSSVASFLTATSADTRGDWKTRKEVNLKFLYRHALQHNCYQQNFDVPERFRRVGTFRISGV